VTLDPVYVDRLRRIAAGEDGTVMARPVGDYVAPSCAVVDDSIAGVPVRRYAAEPTTPGPTLVWLHGGGFSAGDLDMPESDVVARELVRRTGVSVVSVGYRLAAFPAGLDDVVAVVCSFEAPVVLGGTSAGANLALAAALRLRESSPASRRLAGLVLAYPYLHVAHPPAPPGLAERMATLPESSRFGEEKMRAMAAFYLGPLADRPPPRAYPGTDADYAGLPRTLVIGAEYDDLLSSACAAVDGMRAAAVEVEEHLEPGVLHGHLNTPGLPGALRTLETMARFIRSLPAR
jgi:acetyl esterase